MAIVLGKKTSLFSVFFTFAVDNLGATIVFPIFAPLFLDSRYGMILQDDPLSYKTLMLGLFLAIYPFMQFIFSPLMGDYADHKGRQQALILTTLLTCVGFFLCGLGITYHRLLWLFVGRLIMGIGSGNLSICMSALSDLSDIPEEKVRYFSYGSALAGLTFVLGPFLGGKLSDHTVWSYFTIASPLWIGGLLALINLLFIFFFYNESIKYKIHTPYDLLRGLHNIQTVLRKGGFRRLYIVYFFYLLAWNIFFQFMPAYAVEKFNIGTSTIGDIAALMGLCWIFGSGVLSKIFHDVHNPRYALATSFLIFAIFTYTIGLPSRLLHFSILIGIATVVSGVIWPLITALLSNAADDEEQGKVLGLSQSVLSSTMMISALAGGYFLQIHLTLPFTLSAAALIIAGLWILTYSEKPKEN